MKLAVLIPSYNTGAALLRRTVHAALAQWPDVWVIIDGSTDGSAEALESLGAAHPGLQVFGKEANEGKGAAVKSGAEALLAAGFTHALTMDADGQHPADHMSRFIALSTAHPEAVLLGRPVFGPEAPALRVYGRRISNAWAAVETLGWGLGDSLFGMRLYPLQPLLQAFAGTGFARRFDFDTEIAVRLAWQAVPMIQLGTPVRYLSQDEGGVSQFRYGRDNVLLTWMHARLLCGFLRRLPWLLWRTVTGGNPLRRHST
jgi:glycosyltransferase involved in cell wall biosynthesis